jgi:hypothetical protein
MQRFSTTIERRYTEIFDTNGTDQQNDELGNLKFDKQKFIAELNKFELNLAKFAKVTIKEIENTTIDQYLTILEDYITENRPRSANQHLEQEDYG